MAEFASIAVTGDEGPSSFTSGRHQQRRDGEETEPRPSNAGIDGEAPPLIPIVTGGSIPLARLLPFAGGGLSLSKLSVRVNAEAVTADRLRQRTPFAHSSEGTRRGGGNSPHRGGGFASADAPSSFVGASGVEASAFGIPSLVDDGDEALPMGGAPMQPPPMTAARGDSLESGADGNVGDVRSPNAAAPSPTAGNEAANGVGSASLLLAKSGSGLGGGGGGRYGRYGPNHEDSVQFDRMSVTSPIPNAYSPFEGAHGRSMSHSNAHHASRPDSPSGAAIGGGHSLSAAAALLASPTAMAAIAMMKGAGSAATPPMIPTAVPTPRVGPSSSRPAGVPPLRLGSDPSPPQTSGAPSSSGSVAGGGGRGRRSTHSPSSLPRSTKGAAVDAAPRSFLDCLVCDPRDEASGHGLSNVLGAIAYALHRTPEAGATYAAAVRRLYAVDAPHRAHKSKLPLEKLFRCLARPNAVIDGVALEFLIVEDDNAADADDDDEGMGGDEGGDGANNDSGEKPFSEMPQRHTRRKQSQQQRSAFFSHEAAVTLARAERHARAEAKGFHFVEAAPEVPSHEPVLVCLRLRRRRFEERATEAKSAPAYAESVGVGALKSAGQTVGVGSTSSSAGGAVADSSTAPPAQLLHQATAVFDGGNSPLSAEEGGGGEGGGFAAEETMPPHRLIELVNVSRDTASPPEGVSRSDQQQQQHLSGETNKKKAPVVITAPPAAVRIAFVEVIDWSALRCDENRLAALDDAAADGDDKFATEGSPMLPLMSPDEVLAFSGRGRGRGRGRKGDTQRGRRGKGKGVADGYSSSSSSTSSSSSSSSDSSSSSSFGEEDLEALKAAAQQQYQHQKMAKQRHRLHDPRRTQLARPCAVAASAAAAAGGPFAGLSYPTLGGSDTGLFAILRASMHPAFTLNRIRLPLSLLLLVIMLALACASLHLMRTRLEGCCVPVEETSRDDDVKVCVSNLTAYGEAVVLLSPVGGLNATTADTTATDPSTTPRTTPYTLFPSFTRPTAGAPIRDPIIEQCEEDMCARGPAGRLSGDLKDAFLYGLPLSAGRIVAICIGLIIVTVALTALVSFFATRPAAVASANARFFIVPYLLQLAVGGLVVAGTVATAVEFYKANHVLDNCDSFGKSSQKAALCRAEYEGCGVRLVVSFGSQRWALPWICIVLAGASVLQFLVSLIPPILSAAAREAIPPAVPDTMIFMVGRYAPDGITEEEISELHAEIRARWRRERFHRMVRSAVDEYKSATAAERNNGMGGDTFVGRGVTAKDAATSLARGDGSGGQRTIAGGGGDPQKKRLLRVAQLLIAVGRFRQRGGGGKRAGGLGVHYPDPTRPYSVDGNGGGYVSPAMYDAIDALSDKVLERIRAGAAAAAASTIGGADGAIAALDRQQQQQQRGRVGHRFSSASSTAGSAAAGGGILKRAGSEGSASASVWDVLAEATRQVVRSEGSGLAGAGEPNASDGARMLAAVRALDGAKVEEHVRAEDAEGVLQRRVIDHIARRLAREALLLRREEAAMGNGGSGHGHAMVPIGSDGGDGGESVSGLSRVTFASLGGASGGGGALVHHQPAGPWGRQQQQQRPPIYPSSMLVEPSRMFPGHGGGGGGSTASSTQWRR